MSKLGFNPFGTGLSEPRFSEVCAICRRPVNGHNMKDLCTCQPYMAPAGTVPPTPAPAVGRQAVVETIKLNPAFMAEVMDEQQDWLAGVLADAILALFGEGE